MSSIDNRIVRMQFDNEDFERGVMQSMRTIDALNEKLQFKEADKGISALQVHLNNVDFSGMSNAIQHIENSFTSMTGIVARHIKEDIVEEVISAAKKLEQMTLGQIKSGGMARAKNIANAKFMIEGLKFDWEAVRQAADYAVTDTAYGLDAAAKAASQLAASGVDFMETIEEVNGTKLTQMHKSLRAISGVAAMTNSSYEEIAHIFTAVAGMGKLTAMQMNQLSLRGLNIASTIAEQTGKTEQEIREMVSKGMIDFQMFSEAMDEAYGEHAKEANKTFEGSLSNLKAALSRIGAIFTQPVIDKTNTFFVALTGRIKEFQKALNDEKSYKVTEKALARITKEANDYAKAQGLVGTKYASTVKTMIEANKKAILENKESIKNGDVEEFTIARFATHFAEAWEAAINYVSKVTESLDLSWFKSIGTFLDNAAQKVTKFFNRASTAIDKVKTSVEKTSESIADSLELDMNDLDLLHRILKNEFGYVEERWAKLDQIYKEQGSTKTGKWLQGYMDQLAAVGYHFETLGWTEEEFRKKQEDLAKSESERVKEMTAEEVVIESLAVAMRKTSTVIDYMKKSFVNLKNGITSLLVSLVKVSATFSKGLFGAIDFEEIGKGLMNLTAAIGNLLVAISVSDETIGNSLIFGGKLGEAFNTVLITVINTAKELLNFVAACIKANESLDDLAKNESLTALQRTTLNVLRILNNIWRFFKAVGTVAVKVAKSIGTAFNNVFGGKELGRGLSLISGGIQGITDGIATAAEKIAEAEIPFKVLEGIFGTIFMVVDKVLTVLTKFTSTVRQVVNGTNEVGNATDKALQKGKKSLSFLEIIGTYVGKAIIWLKDLPNKIKTVWETLKKTEGFKHLEKSFKNLKTQVKSFVENNLGPMKKSLGEVANEAGGTGETLLGKLASGLGIVADKIAGFMDRLPTYGTKIKEFFENIKTWVDKTVKDLGLDRMGQSIATAFGDLFTGDESIFKKIRKFADTVFNELTTSLSNIDWGAVGKGSLLALVAANMFNFFKISDNVNKIIKGVADLPSQIGSFLKGLGGVFKTAQSSMERASKAYLFTAIAQSVVSVAGAILLLKDVPKDDLNKALAALLMIGVIMLAIGKAIGYILYGTKGDKLKNACNNIDNSTKALVQINNSFGRFAGVAMVMLAAGGAIWMVTKAIGNLKDAFKGLGRGEAQNVISQFKVVIGIVAGIAGGMVLISMIASKIGAAKDLWKTLVGCAALMTAIGAGTYLIVKAIEAYSNIENLNPAAIYVVLGTVFVVGAFTALLTKAMQDVDWKSLLAVVGVLAIMALAVGAVLFEIVALAAIMTGADVLGLTANGDNIKTAALVVGGIVVALGAAMFLIGKGLNKMEKPSALLFVISGMAAVIIAVAMLFKTLTNAVGNTDTAGLALTTFGMIAVLGLIALSLERSLKMIESAGAEEGSKALLSLGLAFIMISASLMIIAKAAETFANEKVANGIVPALGFLVVMAVTLGAIAKAISKASNIEALNTAIQSIAVAFIAMGGAMLLIGLAAQQFASVPIDALKTMGIIMGIMVGLFAAIAIISVALPGSEGVMKSSVKIFKDLSMALLMMGASVLLAGIGCGILAAGLGKLAEGIGVLANAFNEHKVTVAILIAMVAMIAIVIGLVLKTVEPVAPLVLNTTTKVLDAVSTVVSAIGSVLKNGKDKFVKWWKNMQPGLKIMIASGIVTVCGAILKASPEVLNTIKKLIWKVLDFLIDIIPTLVEKLFNLLVKLINSLANTIRDNAAVLAAAFWNLVESILEVLLEVLNQLVMLIVGDGKIGKAVSGVITEAKGMMRAHVAEIQEYAEGANDAANQVAMDYLKMDAAGGGLEAAAALKEMETQLDDTAASADKAAESVDSATDSLAGYYAAKGKASSSGTSSDSGLGIDTITDKLDIDPEKMLGGGNADQVNALLAQNGADGADSFVNGYSVEMEEQHSELYDTTNDAVQEGPVEALTASEQSIKNATEYAIVRPMNEAIFNSKGRMLQNACHAMKGAIEGISMYNPLVVEAMEKLADEMDKHFQDELDINSPSKVFMKNGEYILRGLIKGIDDGVPQAEGSMDNLANTIINTFGDPLNYISKIASGELSVDPSIQPVLDTSKIARGSAAVRTMLNGQAVSIGGLSGQIAADIGDLDSRNLDIVMELRALREDMAMMGDEISNMQVVMDTGALVGATAGQMDKALGQRSIRFGRGN